MINFDDISALESFTADEEIRAERARRAAAAEEEVEEEVEEEEEEEEITE